MNTYRITVSNVVDGDTVCCNLYLGFGVVLENQMIRINGIDTPESRTKDLIEKKYGIMAKNRLRAILSSCTPKLISSDRLDKFGRILGDFRLPSGALASDVLIGERLAVRYDGKSKEQIREEHIKNWEFLERSSLAVC